MKFINIKQQRIHPENRNEMQHLANKWGITMRQLSEAIVDTGSMDMKKLKEHLKKKGVLQFLATRWMHSIVESIGLTKFTKA